MTFSSHASCSSKHFIVHIYLVLMSIQTVDLRASERGRGSRIQRNKDYCEIVSRRHGPAELLLPSSTSFTHDYPSDCSSSSFIRTDHISRTPKAKIVCCAQTLCVSFNGIVYSRSRTVKWGGSTK